MYTQQNGSVSRAVDSSTASEMQCSGTAPPPPPPQQQPVQGGELEWLHEWQWQLNSEMSLYNSCSSGCTSYMSSPRGACLMQRSVSSHSLNNKNTSGTHHYPFSSSSPLFPHFLHNAPVRRACSTGDLQRFNGMRHYHHSDSPLSSESSLIIEEMSRTSPYSPEEKKVRIERYRSKRNQRNFTKKIKYACRKTLADSRPRVRGRFARNDEIAMNHPPVQWSHMGNGEEEEEEEENWANFFDSLAPSNIAQDSLGSSSFGVFY